MICQNCATENRPGSKFCTECAAPLASVCPACGSTNSATAKFCSECATPLVAGLRPAGATPTGTADATTGAPTSGLTAGLVASAPSAERRLVSVLFADLVGFTPFAEERDAEEVRETLIALLRPSRRRDRALRRHGREVHRRRGHGRLGRAGRARGRRRAGRPRRRSSWSTRSARSGPTIQARAGVLTGEAAVTIGATNQGMVAGDIVNTAAPPAVRRGARHGPRRRGDRAGQRARPSRSSRSASRCSRARPRRCRPGARCASSPSAAGATARRRSRRRSSAATRSCGCSRTCSTPRAAKDGRAWCRVIGPGGHRQEPPRVGVPQVHRRPRRGRLVARRPLARVRRGHHLLGARRDGPRARRPGRDRRRGDDPARRSPKASPATSPTTPSALDRAGAARPARARVPTVAADQLFGAWRTFFERIADHGRRWSWSSRTCTSPTRARSTSSTTCSSGADGLPIYVVTLARPDLLERRPDWGAGQAQLRLDLPRAAVRRQRCGRCSPGSCPGLPDDAPAAIVARADGIPLYAVETVRMLVADGRLVHEDGVYRPVGDLTDAGRPRDAHRPDRRPARRARPADRALIARRRRPRPELHRGCAGGGVRREPGRPRAPTARPGPARAPDARCRSALAGAGPVRLRPGAHPRGRLQHAVEEGPQGSHLAAARYFEALGTDELAGALATHYLAAHANSPEGPEAEAVAAQARIALRGAAERAIELGSFAQAVTFYDQAGQISDDASDRADLLLRAARRPPKVVSPKRRTLAWGRHSTCGEGGPMRLPSCERRSPWRSHTSRASRSTRA